MAALNADHRQPGPNPSSQLTFGTNLSAQPNATSSAGATSNSRPSVMPPMQFGGVPNPTFASQPPSAPSPHAQQQQHHHPSLPPQPFPTMAFGPPQQASVSPHHPMQSAIYPPHLSAAGFSSGYPAPYLMGAFPNPGGQFAPMAFQPWAPTSPFGQPLPSSQHPAPMSTAQQTATTSFDRSGASGAVSTTTPDQTSSSDEQRQSPSSGSFDVHASNKAVIQQRQIIVKFLTDNTNEHQFRALFEQHGPIENARIIFDRKTGHTKGFGFVTYCDAADAVKALRTMGGYRLHGRQLNVALVQTERKRAFAQCEFA